MMRKIFITLLLFLFVFGIPFSFLPFNSSKAVCLALISWFLVLKLSQKKNTNTLVNNKFFYIFIGLLALNLLSFIYPVFYGTQDYSIPYAYFIMLLEAFLGGYLLFILFLNKYNFYELLKLIIFISFIQSSIILLMLISEQFREVIYLISNVDAKQLMERYGGFRGFGLAGSVTYDLAVFLALSLIFITYLVSVKAIVSRFYIIVYSIIFTAAIMTGRSAWIGIALSIVIILWNFRRSTLLVKVFEGIVYVLVLGTSLLALIKFIYPDVFNIFLDKIVPYAFEMFINLFNSGKLSTSSSDVLNDMYFPISESTFLLGDGYYKDPNNSALYYMRTDAGYMRHILYYGFFPSMFLYLFYLLCFYTMYRSLRRYQSSFILISSLSSYYFVMHYKGDFLTGSGMNIKLFFILLVFSILIPGIKKSEN
ncbi:MAG: hypothetical protein ACTINA_10280 [Pseudoalteromonas distincta]